MRNKMWSAMNALVGACNIVVAMVSVSPKWYTIVCIGVSFFFSGMLFASED